MTGIFNLKKAGLFALTTTAILTLSLATPTRTEAGLETIATGVQIAGEVIKTYTILNPPQTGYVRVINTSNEEITVRSYNNNDWAQIIAAGQLNLKPGQQGQITAATDPIRLLWKRGRYGNLRGFGPDNLGQGTVTKDKNYVFVIGQDNLF